MRPLDPRLLRLAAPARQYVAVTSVLGCLVAVLVVLQAWTVADVVAGVQQDDAGLAALGAPLAVLLAVVVLRSVCAGLQETAGHRAAARVQAVLRQAVVRHSAELGPRGRGSVGAHATLVTRGVEALEPYLARFLPQLVLAAVVPVVVLAQIAWVDPLSGLLVAGTLPLVPLFMVLVGRHTQERTARQWRTLSVLAGHFLDVVQGLPTLKVFGRARAQVRAIREVSEQHRKATERALRVAFLSALVLELVATLSVAVVAVGVGLRLLDGRMDLRTALVVLILVPEAYLPLRNVGSSFHASSEGVAAAAAALDVLERPLPRGGAVLPAGLGAVSLVADGLALRGGDRLGYRLPPTSLRAAPGEKVAVVGRTGAGKSSLLEALLGAVTPDAGRLTVDGVPVPELDLPAWRARVAWLPQRPLLTAGSVADNVRFGEPDASDAEVRDALALAAADFVEGLPGGLDAAVGERGAGLSAGQQQRVALARVLLRIDRRRPALVLLDEPTAHLDHDTEARVLESLAGACAGATTVVVTHRPAAARAADRVVVLGVHGRSAPDRVPA